MDTHCSHYESLVFHGKILGAEGSISVRLQPGLQYGFRYGVPGAPPVASFSTDYAQVRGDCGWRRFGDTDWASLTLSFDGGIYTIWVSRPEPDDDPPRGQINITGRGEDAIFVFEQGSIISRLPFD